MHLHFFTKKAPLIILLGTVGLSAPVLALAWTGPTAAPPGGTVPATPVNIGATSQTKSGPISALGLTSTNGIDVSNAGGLYTYITLHDSDESPNGVKYIHANSNNIGFLSGQGGWITRWDNSGNQVTNGTANFAGNVTVGSGYIDTNGSLHTSQGALFQYNGDVYMPWLGKWLSQTSVGGTAFGGGFEISNGGACYVGNVYSGGCWCPGYAPYARYSYYMDTNSTYGGGRGYICGGG